MSNPFAMGFVARFNEPLDETRLRALIASWLDRFERLEQVVDNDVATLQVGEPGEVRWEKNMQFRILDGGQFAWVYITKGSKLIETTGMSAGDEASLCLTLLTELPGIAEIVHDNDEKRLAEMEAEGLL